MAYVLFHVAESHPCFYETYSRCHALSRNQQPGCLRMGGQASSSSTSGISSALASLENLYTVVNRVFAHANVKGMSRRCDCKDRRPVKHNASRPKNTVRKQTYAVKRFQRRGNDPFRWRCRETHHPAQGMRIVTPRVLSCARISANPSGKPVPFSALAKSACVILTSFPVLPDGCAICAENSARE